MKTLTALIFAIPVLLTGCATNQLSVTYYSDPPGATIKQADGSTVGRAPVTLNYTLSEDDKRSGSKSVMGVSAHWISGAQIIDKAR